MIQPFKYNDRLAEIINDIATQGGEITPEQEAELLGFDVAHLVNAIKAAEYRATRLKEIEQLVRSHRKVAEQEEELLRPRARDVLGAPGTKAEDPDGLWKASVSKGVESVKLLGPIEEVPEMFRKERVEVSVNHELAKTWLAEPGREILSNKTGLPILKLERTPSIRIALTDRGKQAEIEAQVATVLGETVRPLQLVKGAK